MVRWMVQSEVGEVEMASAKKTPREREPGEVPVGVRLGPELRAQVDAVCEAEGIPLGRFIRDAVQIGVQNKPGRQVRVLAHSLAVAAAQFEHSLKLGVLAGTEAEKQAEDIRAFFGQFLGVLKGQEPGGDGDEPEEKEDDS